MSEELKPDSGKAAAPGIITGVAAVFFNFIVLKENRVVEGTGHRLFQSTSPWLWGLILLLLLIVFLMCRLKNLSGTLMDRTLKGAGIVLMGLTLLALSQWGIIYPIDQYPYGRISPSTGAWLLLLSSYLLINAGGGTGQSRGEKLLHILPWILISFFVFSGSLSDLGIFKEFENEKRRFRAELGGHLYITLRSVSQAVIIGIPMGILAWKNKKTTASIFGVINSLQTIPSLALFGLLIPPLAWLSFRYPALREMGFKGVGQTPAIIALTLYALLPIVRNTYTSLSVIEDRLLDAGRGMGMTPGQLFFRIELPIGLPVILSGIRVAMVQTTGNATVAALIGAGGLGFFVFRGLEQAAPDLILMGVIPIMLLVIVLDKLMGLLVKLFTPKGLETLYDSI
jgi:osmoprotectant transport system permease protein